VNVTPDKRSILIEREKYLLAMVRASIGDVLRHVPATYECSRTLYSLKGFRVNEDNDDAGNKEEEEESQTFSIAMLKKSFSVNRKPEDESSGDLGKQTKLDSFIARSPKKRNYEVAAESFRVLCSSGDDVITKPVMLPVERRRDEERYSEPHIDDAVQKMAKKKKRKVVVEDDSVKPSKRKGRTVTFSLERILKRQEKWQKKSGDTSPSTSGRHRRFLSKISPDDNHNAESELTKHFSKSDFLSMKIVGQFNLGFILSRLGHDLFIIDQHASDEKYNFERLQAADNVLSGQDMVVPQRLELTAAAEAVLTDNLDVFKRNGFEFDTAEPGNVRLTRIPHHRNWIFGKDDVDELIFLLSESGGGDSSGRHLRPSRVRAMFASRACRTSVMVGTALSKTEMKRLVAHMADLAQPWNCPHGRPTMRHVISLKMVNLSS
jgi:DNA mismatch repair protein PMS2